MSRADSLTTALLFFSGGMLVASAMLENWTAWPGVALAALSLAPQAWEAWLGRAKGADAERVEQIDASLRESQDRMRALEASANVAVDALGATLKEHQDQINSLRNAVSLRGTFGG